MLIELGAEVGDFARVGEGSRILRGVWIWGNSRVNDKTYVMPHYDTGCLLQKIETPEQETIDTLNALPHQE